MRWLALAVAPAIAFVLAGTVEQPAPPSIESEMDKALALAAARTPHDVGSRIGDKRRLSSAERLAVLRSQLDDPNRNMTFDAELRAEIERIERRLGVKVASKEGR